MKVKRRTMSTVALVVVGSMVVGVAAGVDAGERQSKRLRGEDANGNENDESKKDRNRDREKRERN